MKPYFGVEEEQAAAGAVRSGWVAQGPRVKAFEEAVCARTGAAQGVAVSSCTTGLHLALVAAGVGAGDDVVCPSLSYIATANAARYVGANPVFADVDLDTQNVTAATIEAVITPHTKAVILVHQVGMPADVHAIQALCEPSGIAVIEDAACAIGSRYKGAMIGAHSDLVVLSFHPRKIVTTGEGGMVLTRRTDWGDRMRLLRQHAMSVSDLVRHGSHKLLLEAHVEVGYNYRMTDIQAAVGLVQLGRLDDFVARRREQAAYYAAALADIPHIALPHDPPWGQTNFQSYAVRLDPGFPLSRNDLVQHMMDRDISPRRGIMAAHLEPAYAGHAHGPLPVTERLTRDCVILPMFHAMTDAEQDCVIDAFHEGAR